MDERRLDVVLPPFLPRALAHLSQHDARRERTFRAESIPTRGAALGARRLRGVGRHRDAIGGLPRRYRGRGRVAKGWERPGRSTGRALLGKLRGEWDRRLLRRRGAHP